MLRRIVTYSLVGIFSVAVVLTVAGFAVKRLNAGRIAPGIVLCGRDVSGMTVQEAEQVIEELVPEMTTELRCRFLPEMSEEVENRVREMNERMAREDDEKTESGEAENAHFTVSENEICFTTRSPFLRVSKEETIQAVTEKSSEVKIWEWLYGAVTRHPLRIRNVEASLVWEEARFREYAAMLCEVTERERKDATVGWERGQVEVTESRRGFRPEPETLWQEMGNVVQSATERIQAGPVEGLVLRFYMTGTVLMPRVSTAQAKKCNTVIGAFATAYTGAGNGRTQNIEAGAKKLHGAVVLPGEIFSVAAALMPFTEESGYAAGGTYIDGQLSESIGGGVCQLSTTLYNALLQTKLEIVERHPHSMPVGYVPLGQDAAIAGDYKDLKFKNTAKAPVLLLCEAVGEQVKVTVYGPEEAKRGNVTVDSMTVEETEDSVTAEVYRTETGVGGKVKKERVSRDKYRVGR